MSGLFKTQNQQQYYLGLQVQTAVSTLPIPIVWGANKIAPNLVWYANFRVNTNNANGGGKGGLFGSGGNGPVYTADIILAVCEGPVTGVNEIWKDQSIYTLSGGDAIGLAMQLGTTPQTPWSYLVSTYGYPQDLAYQGTAYFYAPSYPLTSSATVDDHWFEIYGLRYGTGYGQRIYTECGIELLNTTVFTPLGTPYSPPPATGYFDADPSLVISDFLTNAQFGVGFPEASIDQTTLLTQGGGNDASVQTYCRALGIAFSPALTSQEQASSILARWLQLLNVAAVWSNGTLRFIPYGDTAVTGNGITYQPSVTPIYNLGDDDYIVEDGEDPLQVSVSDLYEAYNVWRLEYSNRNNPFNTQLPPQQYALTPCEVRDQNAIELVAEATGTNGIRLAPTVTAHEICDEGVAAICGQLMLQRAVYIRNTYKFRLSWEYCLLDPMDLVTVTDAVLGLANAAIRITEIEEDENGYLEITAEEFPQGVATATLYPTATGSGNVVNRNAGVGSVNQPIIFEPTDELGGGLQIWAAISNSNPLYGGCNILVSTSASGNFSWIGTLSGNSNMGVSTADLPAVAVNPVAVTIDGLGTLAVNLAESNGSLAAASQTDITTLDNPCYVGGEIICFGSSTLTAANNYNLTGLARGVYGSESAIVDHPSGTAFARLDNVFKYPFGQGVIGQTLYFKFQSFNAWGGGVQSLADCAAYPYTVTGSALLSPLPDVSDVYSNYQSGFQYIYWDQVTDFRSGIVYEIRQGASWNGGLFMRTQAHPPFIAPGSGTYWIAARCQPVAGGPIVYSETPVSIEITGNQLALTYAQGFDEFATGFSGSLDYGLNGGATVSASLSLNTTAAANPATVALGTAASTTGAACAISNVDAPPGATIVVLVNEGSGPTPGGTGAVADGINSGNYQLASSVPFNGDWIGCVFYFANSAALSNATITYTKKITGNFVAMSAFYVTGLAAGSVLDAAVTATATGNSNAASVTSGLPSAPYELILGAAFFAAGASVTFTQVSGFTAPVGVSQIAGSEGVGCGILIDAAQVAETYAPTFSIVEPWGAIVVGFKASMNQVSLLSLPSLVGYGFAIADSTSPSLIPSGASIQSIDWYGSADDGPLELTVADTLATVDYGSVASSATTEIDDGAITDLVATVTLNANVGGAGPAAGDTIALAGVPLNVPLYYEPPNTHAMTSGYLANAAVNVNAAFSGTLFNANFLGLGDFLDDPDFLGAGETSYVDGWVEIATAANVPPKPAPQWGAWQQFTPGVFPATAWKLRIGLQSSSPAAVPTCSAFSFSGQFPTRTDNYVNQAVPAAGLTIVFTPDGSVTAQPFNSGVAGNPLPRVQVDWQATVGDTYQITGLSLSQLTITFFNGGSAVARTATVVVQGA
jgi:hypothetical protein